MAEELAVDDVRGDRLAVQGKERTLGTKARSVDRSSDRFLARARLADDQDREAVAGGLGGDRERGAEFGCGADQLLELERRRELFRNGRELARRAAAIGIRRECIDQPLRRNGADEEIGCSGAHGFDGAGNGVTVRQDDHRQVRPILPQRFDELRALLGVPGTEDRCLDFAAMRPLEQGERHLRVGGANDAPADASRNRRDQPALVRIGVEQQE
jgi:hypothetical protein